MFYSRIDQNSAQINVIKSANGNLKTWHFPVAIRTKNTGIAWSEKRGCQLSATEPFLSPQLAFGTQSTAACHVGTRSPILVPIESTTFLLVINTNLPPILHRFQVTVKFSLARGECLTLRLSLRVIPANIAVSDMSLKTGFFGLHFCRRKYQCIFNHFHVIRPESYRIPWNYAAVRPITRSRSFKVTEFGTNQKLICDFLLVINSNLPPILHRFRDIALERSKIVTFFYPSLV